jgi:hypothetical protein
MLTVISIIIILIIIYKIIENNYQKRLSAINLGIDNLRKNDYALVHIKPALFIGTLKSENYETYVSPMALGFMLDDKEILVMSTTKENSLIVIADKLDEIDENKLDELISQN